MAVFSKMENPWQKELQKIPTKPPVQEPLVSSKPPSGVILGPYSTNNIASSNKRSTSPPPIPAYLTMPPREKIVHRGQEKSHMAAVKQIFINCITLRNLRVIMRHISPRGTLVLCLLLGAIFLLFTFYSSSSPTTPTL